LTIELESEADGRWLAAKVEALALRVIAERLEHRASPAESLNVTFQAA
jgi:hypothetical protein